MFWIKGRVLHLSRSPKAYRHSLSLRRRVLIGKCCDVWLLGVILFLRASIFKRRGTFCLAFGFSRSFFETIFKAYFFLSPILSTSKHSANPPMVWMEGTFPETILLQVLTIFERTVCFFNSLTHNHFWVIYKLYKKN